MVVTSEEFVFKRGSLNNFWIRELPWSISRFHRWGNRLKSGQELTQVVEDAGEICLPPKSDPVLLPSNADHKGKSFFPLREFLIMRRMKLQSCEVLQKTPDFTVFTDSAQGKPYCPENTLVRRNPCFLLFVKVGSLRGKSVAASGRQRSISCVQPQVFSLSLHPGAGLPLPQPGQSMSGCAQHGGAQNNLPCSS